MYLQKEVQYQVGNLIGSNEGTKFRGIMTFMVIGLRNNIPFLVKAVPDFKIEGKWLSKHTNECVKSLHDIGLCVHGVISDSHTTNVVVYQELCTKYELVQMRNCIDFIILFIL